MKAAVLYGNEDIRYADWETPVCRPGTVKVRVRATGICGSDVPRVLNHGAHFYPVVLGHEFSGDIAEVGEGVEGLEFGAVAEAPGDADGAHAGIQAGLHIHVRITNIGHIFRRERLPV